MTFLASTDGYVLPTKFTFPFYYRPHPLCIQAATELQNHLETQQHWRHNFGLSGNIETAIGKMFGVLLVKNKAGELGYLAAFSGKLADKNHWPNFVPPVFDMLEKNSFFLSQQKQINNINNQVEKQETLLQELGLDNKVQHLSAQMQHEVSQLQTEMSVAKQRRKQQRIDAKHSLASHELERINTRLNQQSIAYKKQLLALKQQWLAKIALIELQLAEQQAALDLLKQQRKHLSSQLQQQLFKQYEFLNLQGEVKDLNTIFSETTPPAGAGECAAPKLLQYAFKQGYQPLAMAEFWWGASPKSEVRKHQYFYPACHSKCEPILSHMLQGMDVDDNPMMKNMAAGKSLEIIYQDASIVVINKPEEFLSVPGKNVTDSVYTRMKQQFPEACGPLIVHRLDMSTSGLMVIALTKQANKHLQQQFITREVKKRYVALLDGELSANSGEISLPLRVDLDDRPRQLVCFQHGKSAHTQWQVIERKNGKTRVYLYPKTGRTHQLRVHCAHVDGLNLPIVGDDLYGQLGDRLHLHAQQLSFRHPDTSEQMVFEVAAKF